MINNCVVDGMAERTTVSVPTRSVTGSNFDTGCFSLWAEDANEDAGFNNIWKFGIFTAIIIAIIILIIVLIKLFLNQQQLINKWEFPIENLTFGKCLGEGAFGVAVMATAIGLINKNVETKVAVKMLKDDHRNYEDILDFKSEIDFMKKMGNHNNITTILGSYEQDGSPCAIIEFASKGNILNFLNSMNPRASEKELLLYANQVAQGMEYMHDKNLIHRDLAGRNILVTEKHNKIIMKIADFGLARDIGKEGYYIEDRHALNPRWIAPESVNDNIFTFKSDVWTYGVLLWEIFTYGKAPDYIPLSHLSAGKRLDQPLDCSAVIYMIMLSCWDIIPEKRPTFQELVKRIEQILSSSREYLKLVW
ncbi:fibroblast growth factor receptor 1 isoform X4 [Acyrthosiphon pisum]|uniref:Protein kinase domain-containing protein n=1 Tax=Acyrthosiphon pisum TaxID=7029 RepID=A0A8R2BAX0_ACYPI|nr:fibroblast growth factor receptor 1 isoform X4 [Acyrthosiphon pisum]|eukprot:XP_008190071.1 PREDICTED: fibroblast growth factor receptor 1-like isoform X4 [Acyrthosiphon pisum]